MNELPASSGVSADEFFAAALRAGDDWDDDERWDAIHALQGLSTDEVFDRAVALTRSGCVLDRTLGVDVLAQIGLGVKGREQELRRMSVPVLLDLVERERDRGVLISLAHALGHRRDTQALPALVRLASHPDEEVRYAVAKALPGLVTAGGDARVAVRTLIDLTRDADDDVRDWATAGLGVFLEGQDSPELREALVARLDDAYGDVRGEALQGLVIRGDPRGRDALKRELEGDPAWMAVHASELLGDRQMLPALIALRDRGWADGEIDEMSLRRAIERLSDSASIRS